MLIHGAAIFNWELRGVTVGWEVVIPLAGYNGMHCEFVLSWLP